MSSKRGRRPELTPLVLDRIVQVVSIGVDPDVAAAFAGVMPDTFKDWMARGQKASRGKYRELYDAIVRASADAEIAAAANVKRAAATDYRAAVAYAERRHPERFGKQRRQRSAVAQPVARASRLYLPREQPLNAIVPKKRSEEG